MHTSIFICKQLLFNLALCLGVVLLICCWWFFCLVVLLLVVTECVWLLIADLVLLMIRLGWCFVDLFVAGWVALLFCVLLLWFWVVYLFVA